MKRAKEKKKRKGIDILNLIGTSQEKAQFCDCSTNRETVHGKQILERRRERVLVQRKRDKKEVFVLYFVTTTQET